MRKILLFYVVVIALVSAAQNPGVRPFDDEAIRDMLEGFAVMEDDNEDDPRQKGSLTVADYYRIMEEWCEESGGDKRRILDIAKEEIDRCAAYVKSTGQTPIANNAVRLLDLVAHSGDRFLLPFLEEKSLDPETYRLIRSAAAEVYVNIADVEESAEFMRKLYRDPSVQGSGRYFLNKKFLGRVGAEEKTLTPETKKSIAAFLLGIVQNVENSGEANDADRFLLDRIPEYANSRQRATLCRFANTGNAWVTNTYNPIKAHFDAIPPKQRIDLRKRFPDLPPLPGDAPARSPVKVAIAVVAGIVALAVCAVAAWLAVRRRRVRETPR
ncbi:MAG: hypothetical protein PHG74_15665 [Kiritimatiellae bacterium]|nr:hypothetical protein [Kiritimatiellia bacterium]MDD3585446.1 hypothetical protein [Kiritimatiellia bacterium]